MAIRQQSTSLSQPFEYISKLDEAVDIERENFEEEWERYREGTAACPLKDGLEPTRWMLAPVTNSRLRARLAGVHAKHGGVAMFVSYASHGIESVKNLLDEKGDPVKLRRVRVDGFPQLDDEQIADIPPAVLVEIGSVLVEHNSPNED